MKERRRLGMENARSRALLIEAADQILIEEGAHAISARKVAERAKLKPQLVHYYFKSMDDLLVEVFRRSQEEHLRRLEKALATRRPLNALWIMNSDFKATRQTTEFIALSARSAAVRKVMTTSAKHFRKLQIEAFSRVLKERGIDRKAYPPAGVALMMATLSRGLVMEQSMGISLGHKQLRSMVNRMLKAFEQTGLKAA